MVIDWICCWPFIGGNPNLRKNTTTFLGFGFSPNSYIEERYLLATTFLQRQVPG